MARVAQQAPIPGFVPLKGAATIPIGSTVDARAGRVSVTTAAETARPKGPAVRTQTGAFAAALFAIRQARSRQAARSRRVATDVVLRTPPGRARACAAGSPPVGITPIKGVVRMLSGVAKGQYRVLGGAGVTTSRTRPGSPRTVATAP